MSRRSNVVISIIFSLGVLNAVNAFCGSFQRVPRSSVVQRQMAEDDVLDAAIAAMFGGDDGNQEPPESTQMRIKDLVDENSVLLFMKGNRAFPQCGFSDTSVKILEKLDVDFHHVDVLADEAIRQGIKIFSDWPTIPQLYIDGEFIGGSDIMMEMFESGELKKLVDEKEK